jgi:AcrR family transcriptional regulator
MPKKIDHDARREELVQAVWSVIAARGIDEVTVREIARESGYSPGVLAHYFKNKDDLLVHALRISHEKIVERQDELVADRDGADALRQIMMDLLPLDDQRNLETRIEMSFWARSLRNEALSKIQHTESQGVSNLLGDLVAASQEEGNISADLDRDRVVEFLNALYDGLSLHGLLYPDRLPPKELAAIMDFGLGLLARNSSPD